MSVASVTNMRYALMTKYIYTDKCNFRPIIGLHCIKHFNKCLMTNLILLLHSFSCQILHNRCLGL